MKMKLVLAVYWVACFTLTHLPPSQVPSVEIPNIDKLVHFLIFFGLGFLLQKSFPRLPVRWASVLGILLLYAYFDEATQPSFGREQDILDGVADLTGGCIALWVEPWTRRQAVPLGKE